jgi:hypothetical protein
MPEPHIKHQLQSVLEKAISLRESLGAVIESMKRSDESDDSEQKPHQLKEIAKTIQKLELTGVSIPSELRSLKTSLVAELGAKEEAVRVFQAIRRELREMLGALDGLNGGQSGASHPTESKHQRHGDGKIARYREAMIVCLKENGGSGSASEILRQMESKLRDVLTSYDREINNNGQVRWQHETHALRFQMAKEGILRDDSPRGMWELTEKNR